MLHPNFISGSVFCGALSKNENFAATGGEDDKAFVWDTVSGDIVLECTGHKDSVTFSDFNHDDSYLATGDMGGFIQLWKFSDKSAVWNYEMDDMTVKKHFFQPTFNSSLKLIFYE